MVSSRFASLSEDSLLLRLQTESHSITEVQKSVDVAVTSFMAGLHDIKPVLGMLGGSLAYQGIRSIALTAGFIKPLAVLSGTLAEAATFETIQRSFHLSENPKAFSWEGAHGFHQGLIQSLLNLSVLKTTHSFVTPSLAPFASVAGISLGEHLTYHLGYGEKPEGSSFEQATRAVLLHYQMGLSLGLFYALHPRALEWDRRIRLMDPIADFPEMNSFSNLSLSAAGSRESLHALFTKPLLTKREDLNNCQFPGTDKFPPSKKPELAITADALNSTRNPASNHPKRPLPAAVTVGYDEGAEEAIPPTEYAPHSPRVSSDSLLPLRKGMVLVDRYEVADHLGSGGFGDIYLARDIKEGMGEREVVIKIPRASSYREDTPQRLKREWLLTGQMPDQHTVIMYDLLHLNVERRALDGKKTSTAIWVPVMEHVPGYDFIKYRRALRNHDKEFLLKNELSSVEDRVRLFEAACEALAAVHRLGIVHHDLKLENIREYLPDGVLTTPSKRQVRIMDFGQAKLIDEPEDRNSSSPPPPAASDRRSSKDFKQARELNFLTSPELLSGTPGYIPPERFPPNVYKPDLRADIFQMGIILYELISGTHPAAFYMDNPNPHGPRKISKKTDKGETIILPQSTTIMGAHPPPHLREVMVETSPYLDRLDQIFRKATAQKPEDRYQSIDDMRSDLALLPADLMTDQLKTLEEFQQKNIQLLHQNFTAGNEGLQESLESLSELNREIPLLRERLVGQLTGLAEQGNPLAKARIVEESWKQLTAEDSHLPHSIQTILLDRIRRYAPEQKEKLDTGVALHFSGTDLLQRQPLKDFQVRVLRYQEKRPGVFREGDVLVPSISVSILQHSLRLPVGDYVFEVYHPDYHYFRTAQRVSYAHLQTSVQQEAPLNLHFDFARKQALPSGFAWVSGGESSFGVPLLKVQNPTVLGLMPETKRRLPAFGMSAPVSEADYAGFLSSQLEWVHYYLRRGDLTQAPQMMNRVLSLLPSHWKLTSQGENLATYYSISDFENLTRSSRPVHSLSSQAAQEYAQWKSQQEGHRYQVATPFHLEKVTRNGLAWESPQGKPFRSSDLAQGHDSSVYAFLNKQGQVERLKISSDIYHLESHAGQKGAFRLVIEF